MKLSIKQGKKLLRITKEPIYIIRSDFTDWLLGDMQAHSSLIWIRIFSNQGEN